MDFFEIGSYSGGVWAKSQGQICDEDLWYNIFVNFRIYCVLYRELNKFGENPDAMLKIIIFITETSERHRRVALLRKKKYNFEYREVFVP